MKRYMIAIALSLCANQLDAMKADVLTEPEDADLVGRFQRLEYLERHKFDNDPSKDGAISQNARYRSSEDIRL